MISQINGTAVRGAYQNSETQAKVQSDEQKLEVNAQGDASRVETIKEMIATGEYRVNLEALAQKIADELM